MVLPEPVLPRPNTSRPASVSGRVASWIGNGDTAPRVVNTGSRADGTPSSAKPAGGCPGVLTTRWAATGKAVPVDCASDDSGAVRPACRRVLSGAVLSAVVAGSPTAARLIRVALVGGTPIGLTRCALPLAVLVPAALPGLGLAGPGCGGAGTGFVALPARALALVAAGAPAAAGRLCGPVRPVGAVVGRPLGGGRLAESGGKGADGECPLGAGVVTGARACGRCRCGHGDAGYPFSRAAGGRDADSRCPNAPVWRRGTPTLAFTATTSTRTEMMTSSSTVRGRAPKPGIQSARSPLPTPALDAPAAAHCA